MRPFSFLAFVGMLSLLVPACAQGSDLYSSYDAGAGGGKDSGGTVDEDTGGGGAKDTGTTKTDTGGTSGCTPTSGKTCDLFPQCGCATGENCNVSTTAGATKCYKAGAAGTHESCTGYDQCDKGLQCVGGVCQPLCQVDSDCPSSTSLCRQVKTTTTSGSTVDIPGMHICAAQCEPTKPASLCGSANCTILDDGTTQCIGAGSGTGTGACSSDPLACAAGYVCLDSGDCLKWCRIGFSSDCTGTGGTCTGFTTPLMKGGTEYGVCYSGI